MLDKIMNYFKFSCLKKIVATKALLHNKPTSWFHKQFYKEIVTWVYVVVIDIMLLVHHNL